VVARVLGQQWAALSSEEKEKYQLKAAEERERVSKELEAYKAAGGVIEDSSPGSQKDPNSLIFPVGRIRKIAKLDHEVKGMSKEAILLITKCAEMATAKLGKETVRVAQLQNRRKLLPEDVAQVCSSREQFLFLKDDIKDLLKEQIEENKAANEGKAVKPNAGDIAKETAAQGSKPLTSYFMAK
jgi:DNA-directed RNA polymerase I subunit RPA43